VAGATPYRGPEVRSDGAGQADRRGAGANSPSWRFILSIRLTATNHHADIPAGCTRSRGERIRRGLQRPRRNGLCAYVVGLEHETPWSLETVEIDASLPKLEKEGRLRAIRRLLPLGRPEYQVLEIAGDQTVRQQMIVRYLSAEAQAAAIPASSVAITLANYKFRYKGAVNTGGTIAYAFLITPRKKREGLIKGVLWLDGETGAVVRQSGYLVKKPSIWVKRVNVTHETAFRDGIAEMRVIHLSVDTRLVGRAQLIIHERPCTTPDSGPAPSIAER